MLAGKATIERTHAPGLLVASAIFLVLGAYGLVFSFLYDLTLIPLILLSVGAILAGVGVLLGRRFGLWISLLLFPLAMVMAISTLFYSMTVSGWLTSDIVTVFQTSLILYGVGLVVSLLLVIDRRSQLK